MISNVDKERIRKSARGPRPLSEAWNVQCVTRGRGGCTSLMRSYRMTREEAETLAARARVTMPDGHYTAIRGRWTRKGFVEA